MTVADRVDHLDEVLSEFITSVGIEFNKKSTLRSADIDHVLNEELAAFRTFFPEYPSLPVVSGII